MDVFEAIFSRHSIGKVLPDPLPREVVERLLSAAVQAPNHHRVRPWRFFVLQGQARERLGDIMARSLAERNPQADADSIEIERRRPLRAPVLIILAVDPPVEQKVIEIENVSAVSAAAENLLLAAHALGLGAMWRTGSAAFDPAVKRFLGISADQHIVGIIYVGYPAGEPKPAERPSYEDRTVWME